MVANAASWNRHMALLDGRAYVAGERFTLADIVLGLSINRWLSTPIERPPLPHVAAWYARLAAQAGFAEHCANGVP